MNSSGVDFNLSLSCWDFSSFLTQLGSVLVSQYDTERRLVLVLCGPIGRSDGFLDGLGSVFCPDVLLCEFYRHSLR